MLISINKLAELTGKDRRTIKKRLELLPRDTSPDANDCQILYDSVQALAELYAADHAKSSADDELDLTRERARLAHHQANKTALEEQALAGTLIPREVVEKVQTDMNARARARLLSLPSKAATDVIGMTSMNEVTEAIRRHVYEALAELADFDPAQYRDGARANDRDRMGPTADTDGQSVGGQRAEAKPGSKRGTRKVANKPRAVSKGNTG